MDGPLPLTQQATSTEPIPQGIEDELAPGVYGYTMDQDGSLYIPLINARNPGNGDVGRYLDSLPIDRRVVFPNVISDILEAMLQRRGFTQVQEYSEDFEEYVECWERNGENK